MHRVLSIQRQVAHCLLLKTNELCLSSLLNFHSELWVNPRVPRKPFQPRGPLEISCPREKYNIRKGQKPQKPLKIQGSSLVVPIISLSPYFIFKWFDIRNIFHSVLLSFVSLIGSQTPLHLYFFISYIYVSHIFAGYLNKDKSIFSNNPYAPCT